jgi:hypothetical protein
MKLAAGGILQSEVQVGFGGDLFKTDLRGGRG